MALPACGILICKGGLVLVAFLCFFFLSIANGDALGPEMSFKQIEEIAVRRNTMSDPPLVDALIRKKAAMSKHDSDLDDMSVDFGSDYEANDKQITSCAAISCSIM